MELRDFIPALECALRYADKHIEEVVLSAPGEVTVFFDTDYYISVDVEGCDLMETLAYVALTVREHRD